LVRHFWTTLLLGTTCMRLWGNWVDSCVMALQTKDQNTTTSSNACWVDTLHPRAARGPQRTRSETTTIFGQQNDKAFNMLPWQMHRDTTRWHQICPYPYTYTVLMLANCLLYWRWQSWWRQSPLCTHKCSCPAHTCTQVLYTWGCHASFTRIDLVLGYFVKLFSRNIPLRDLAITEIPCLRPGESTNFLIGHFPGFG